MSDERVGPGPDEDAVAAWLRSLARGGAPGWAPATEAGPPPGAIGPLQALPDTEQEKKKRSREENREPYALPWYEEVWMSAARLPREAEPECRELFEVLARNTRRYLTFNRERLANLYQALRQRDRVTFSAIPFLLHVNMPGVPGFLPEENVEIPHGIAYFDMNATIQSAVEEVLPETARRRRRTRREPSIEGLLAMGSVGTIGHSGKSDIDYWVVVDERRFDRAEKLRLLRKIEDIETWARNRGLDAHFFLVDVERARRNDFGKASADAESSGSAQGKLLKEEFYRTAIFLQGKLPFWWLVPVDIDAGEYDRLTGIVLDRRGHLPVGMIDLGFIDRIDRGEFFGAALWQINKSLKSPFKSLLKMALLARYMDDASARLLCDVLKKRVFEGESAPQFTDPYVLLFDAISEYFAARGDWSAFRLVQKCFYLKVGLKLTRESADRTRFMQRFRVMRAYIARWGWDRELLEELDAIESWTADRVDAFGQAIRGFMLGIYRHLLERARDAQVIINEEDVTILGRRLYACFADEPGKIRHLFTYFLREPRVEERITVLEVPDAPEQGRWEIHRRIERGRAEGREPAMFASSDLSGVAAWLSFNGLFARRTVVSLLAQRTRTTITEFRQMLDRFDGHFHSPDPFSIPPNRFLQARSAMRIALVVNFENRPAEEDYTELAGVYYIPENWDVLNYGRKRESLVKQVTVVTLNTWGEMFCTRHSGDWAVHRALWSLFDRLDPDVSSEAPPEVIAAADRWLPAVRTRMTRICEAMDTVCLAPMPDELGARAYAYEVGGRFQVIRRTREGRKVAHARSLRGVVRQLGSLGPARQEVLLDGLSSRLADLMAVVDRVNNERAVRVCVAFRQDRNSGSIIVLDELGRVWQTRVNGQALDRVLMRTARRVVWHLRSQVRSAAELRRALRVYELKEGRALGQQVQFIDDTPRLLGALARPGPRPTDLILKGDLREGRDGVYLKWGNEVFSPKRMGRRFVFDLVRRILRQRSLYDGEAFAISASDVVFGTEYQQGRADIGLVKHLRLITAYDRMIARALQIVQGKESRVLKSDRRFDGRPAGEGA